MKGGDSKSALGRLAIVITCVGCLFDSVNNGTFKLCQNIIMRELLIPVI
jgi:hypothetical protein